MKVKTISVAIAALVLPMILTAYGNCPSCYRSNPNYRYAEPQGEDNYKGPQSSYNSSNYRDNNSERSRNSYGPQQSGPSYNMQPSGNMNMMNDRNGMQERSKGNWNSANVDRDRMDNKENDESSNEERKDTAEITKADKDLQAKVLEALKNTPSKKDYSHLNIRVYQGVVTVSGTLEDAKEKEEVKNVIKGLDGVKSIDDLIQLRNQTYKGQTAYNDTETYYGGYGDYSREYRYPNYYYGNYYPPQDYYYQSNREYYGNPRYNYPHESQRYSPQRHDNSRYYNDQRFYNNPEDFKNNTNYYRNYLGYADNNPSMRGQPSVSPRGMTTDSDRHLQDQIRDSLQGGSMSKGYDNLQYTVRDGNVTVTGTVNTDPDKAEISKRIHSIPGVKKLDNQTKVQYPRGKGL